MTVKRMMMTMTTEVSRAAKSTTMFKMAPVTMD